MSDIIKEIHEDIEEYKSACRYLNETAEYDKTGYANPYGKHAKEIIEKAYKQGWRGSMHDYLNSMEM
jgi:hypothetical protein